MSDQRRDPEAAAIGVVVAGVLASFVIPGPFDWGSTLIGLMLLLVLFGYGRRPERPRETLGMASAAGFSLVLVFGRLLDCPIGRLWFVDGRRGLSHWDDDELTVDQHMPNADGGWELLGLWAIFVGVVYLVLRAWNRMSTS